LEPYSCILQLWRTSEFEESAPDSFLEIHLEPEGAGTRLTILHSNLPEDGMQYKQGWIDSYFTPMHAYFGTETEVDDF
jgi:activator of HSP90 ATPase